MCSIATEAVAGNAWQPGAPPHVPPAIVAADRRIYSGRRCPACRRGGFRTAAQHNGNRYRIVGKCRSCNHREVF